MSSSNLVLAFDVYRGADRVARQRFTEQSVTIGCGEAALLRVDDGGVSDLHCVINLEPDGTLILIDLGSNQGTIHNGKHVQSAHLGQGGEFFIGLLRFQVAVVPQAVQAAEEPTSYPEQDEATEDGPTQQPTPAAASPRQARSAPTPSTAPRTGPSRTPAPAAAAAAAASASRAAPMVQQPDPSELAPDDEVTNPQDDTLLEDGISFVMRSGTATHGIGVNEKRPKVLEVNQLWGDTLLDSRHFSHQGQRVTIGSSVGYRWHFLGVDMGWVPQPLNWVLPYTPPMWSEIHSAWRNDFYTPDEALPDQRDHDLFTFENDTYVAHVPRSWDGFVDIGDQRLGFDELVGSGRARVNGEQYEIPITDDIRLMVDAHGTTYFAHKVLAGNRMVVRGEEPDYPFIAITSFMLFLGLMFALVVFFAADRPSTGINEIPDRFVEMAIDKPPEEPKKDNKPEANPDAGEGAKAKREEGKVGKKEAKIEKAKGNKVDIQQAVKDRQIAENAGLLGALADDGGMDGAFGSSALDSSLAGSVGGLIGAKGTQIGSGGLGSRGSGLGGGGSAEGLGGLGTKGIGSGKSGYGSGGGNFGAKGEGGIGTVGGDPIILGALDRSLIDEVIKRHMSQIKYCYQRELAKAPSLNGKIVIKFVIAKDGSVSSASPASTTMNNAAVEQCIVGRFMRMKFPEPKGGGIVIVSYPFIFSPG